VKPTQLVVKLTKKEREELLEHIEQHICKLTESMDRERATLGRVTHKSVEWLTTLELLREQLND
jgi:hypothetical protein